MIIKRDQLKNYLRTGCCIKDKNGKPHVVKDVGGNFVSTNNNEVMQHSAITQITNYHVPADITTNIASIGHYVKLFVNTTNHHGYWFDAEWAKIIGVNHDTYPIRIEYLNKRTDNNVKDTVIGKEQIGYYNPFCPEPIIIEEAVVQDMIWSEKMGIKKPTLQYDAIKKVVDKMIDKFNDPVMITTTAPFDFYKTFDQAPKKQKLNFDVLLNEQKIVLDQYN